MPMMPTNYQQPAGVHGPPPAYYSVPPGYGQDPRGVPMSSDPLINQGMSQGRVIYIVQQPGPEYYGQRRPVNIETGDYHEENMMAERFSEKSVRMQFIRKVYGILTVQLVVTFGMVFMFMTVEEMKKAAIHVMTKEKAFMFLLMGLSIALVIALSCFPSFRRKSPQNYVCLGAFTIIESLLIGGISVFYQIEEVLMALAITLGVCAALTLFSFQTKWDFTSCSGFVIVGMVALLIFGIGVMIFPTKLARLVYCSLGAVLFCFVFVYDTQLMLGGNHKQSISPEDYVFAALSLYLDIVTIFLYILQLIGLTRNE